MEWIRVACPAGYLTTWNTLKDQSKSSCFAVLTYWNRSLRQGYGILTMWEWANRCHRVLDSFELFWQLEAILGQHGLVVITRSGTSPEKFIFESDLLSKYSANITIVTNWVANDVSSTLARRFISRGLSVKYLLDDNTIDYITKHQLYRSNFETWVIYGSTLAFSSPPFDSLWVGKRKRLCVTRNFYRMSELGWVVSTSCRHRAKTRWAQSS